MKGLNYNLKEIFKIGKKLLNSEIESQIIIRETLKMSKEEFHISLNKQIDYEIYKEILKKFNLRKSGYPLSYITNKKYFLDYEFIVNKGVFIPRFETEEIVDHILKNYKKVYKTLDICCGTGVIGISLLLKDFTHECTFVDISDKALKNTYLNLKKFNINEDRFKLIKSDMFKNIDSKFNLIISNPPYIKESEYNSLPKDVKREPKEALLSGKDGLNHIKILLKNSKYYLEEKGLLVFEFEKSEFNEIINEIKDFKILEIIKTNSQDISGLILEKL